MSEEQGTFDSAAVVAERQAAAAAFQARATAPTERARLEVIMFEDVDGDYIGVPQGESRDAFLAEHRARREAAVDGSAALVADVEAYAAMSELERVRKFPNVDERQALARLAYGRSPI